MLLSVYNEALYYNIILFINIIERSKPGCYSILNIIFLVLMPPTIP